MTLRSRNYLVTAMLGLLGSVLVLYVILLINLDLHNPALLGVLKGSEGHYFNVSWKLGVEQLTIGIFSSGIAIVLAVSMAIVFLSTFRRVSSPELFFVFLFWASIAFETCKVVNMYLIQSGGSLQMLGLVSRFYYFGRLTGVLCMLSASLYLAGVKMQYQGILLYLNIAISVAVAYLLPIDSTVFRQGMTFLAAGDYSLDPLTIMLGLLSILNLSKYVFTNKEKGNVLLVVSFVLLLLGHELLYISYNWITLGIAWLSLAFSTVWLNRRFVRSYLWY